MAGYVGEFLKAKDLLDMLSAIVSSLLTLHAHKTIKLFS